MTFETASRPSAISVVELDQLGVVAAACLAHLGHRVIGVDIRADRKADMLGGNAPVHEPRIERLLLDGVRDGLITASSDLISAVIGTDVTFITTEFKAPAAHSTFTLAQAGRAMGQALALKPTYHLIVFAGDVPLGGLRDIVRPHMEQASGKILGEGFGLCIMPRFGRAGMSINDFFSRPKTVIGVCDPRAAAAIAGIARLIDVNAIFTTIEAAEMAKRADSLWQATRMAFDEDLGRMCLAVGIDRDEVMELFRHNVRAGSNSASPASTARAGVALHDDLRAAVAHASALSIALPLVESLLGRAETRGPASTI